MYVCYGVRCLLFVCVVCGLLFVVGWMLGWRVLAACCPFVVCCLSCVDCTLVVVCWLLLARRFFVGCLCVGCDVCVRAVFVACGA